MESSARELRDGERRARELYHYFQPDNPALLPTEKSNGKCIDTSLKPPGKSSPNLVLTALAQLAAMRLGVQRAIISLIDRETLYVVAEASKSLNLDKNDLYDDDGDGLWMGCARGPVSGTLCEKTITLRSSSEERFPFFIVDDLQHHPTFCNIPCVAAAPYFRYYAGTPLITSNDITIGSLYVIDPRPNISLTESHKETLGTIANAVMEYMETSRQSLEADRLAKVLSGLNSFVQGAVTSETSNKATYQSAGLWDQDLSHTQSPYQTPCSTTEYESDSYFKDPAQIRSKSSTNHTMSADSSDTTRFTRSSRSPRSARSTRSGRSPRCTPSPPSPSSPLSLPLDREQKSQGASKSPSYSSSRGMSQTFQRAADTIRQSLNLGKDGGVVIFGNNARIELPSTLDLEQDSESKRKLATIWAMSDTEAQSDQNRGVIQSHPAAEMDLHFARRFLRRYRRGGLWHFHQDGTAFSSDEDETASSGTQQGPPDLPSSPPFSMNPQSFGALREKDQQALKKYFPNAKRIMFVPLWDSFNSRWFGGCFSWSCLETRVFSAHVELGGFFGFGSSLMVEYSRIQSQESDKKKDDFISTISHELRSPLHGILAANEFLAEYVESEFAKRLLDTIRACGQTLLDTFEQILDFAKINSFASKRQHLESSSPSDPSRQAAENGASPAQPLRILKLVDVVAIIEDVVESVYSGRILSGAMNPGNSALGRWSLGTEGNNGSTESTDAGGIDVFINAEPRDWEFLLEPGALRRVVMNVFGNALKYTQKGTISVRLEVLQAKGSSSEGVGSPELLLTISDTGKGISSRYLRSDIFTPFSQEDVLSPGTGLGLSLVRDILRSLNGDITIESQVGLGTTVKMTFPLGQSGEQKVPGCSPPISDSPATSNPIRQVKAGLQGKVMHFVTAPYLPSTIPTSNDVIKNYLTEWFGMKIQDPEIPAFIDLLVVDERELDLIVNPHPETSLLILCHRRPSWSTMMESTKQLPNTIWLTLPCGPHQLARTLMGSLKCLKPNQPYQLDEPSPVGFTEQLSELNNILKSHSLSEQQRIRPALAPDAPHIQPASNTTTTHIGLIPRAKPASHGLQADQPGVNLVKQPPTEPGAGIRILLVEDNAINLALLEKYLARTKPEILHTAVNGQEAVKAVQAMAGGYKYIFMDLSMPIVDGFEATRSIRSIERARQTDPSAKIVALTGLGSDEHIMKAYAAGVDVFLTKPISFKDIMRLLDERKDHSPGHRQ
ncbi:CheY-like superfamily [Penicillium sp. IBT 18751x]|nr:CheY-like superfamily [Penicillium sp. IBT 18751x]